MSAGVYIIKNIYNHKVYVGSSVSIEIRIVDHFEALKKNKHYNYRIQKDFNKYGELAFIWGIVRNFNPIYRDIIYDFEQIVLDSYSDKYNINLNSRDHLLEDLSKKQKTTQLKINYGF